MEKELLALFTLHTVGVAIFGRFEAETAWWRLAGKWAVLLGLTWWIGTSLGHTWAVSFVGFLTVTGLIFHFAWCKKKGIHPVAATPRKKYYELRGWEWKE